MKMLKSRRGFIWIPVIVVVITIILIVIFSQIGELCFFGKCFHLISPQFQSELNFWILAVFWIVLQVVFVYVYLKIGFFVTKGFSFIRGKFDRFIQYFRKIFGS